MGRAFLNWLLCWAIQLVAMSTDLLLIGFVVLCAYEFGLVGALFALGGIWWATKDTGGFFFSWRKANRRKFLNRIIHGYDRHPTG